MVQGKKELQQQLIVGATIKIGKQYADKIGGFDAGRFITLVEGLFDYENGLFCTTQTAPSVWNEESKEFDSIYHLFGNNLENFMDCEIINQNDGNENV